ncbi:MAG: FlgD immunoglobulin-like domain containing protein, partial [Rhodothermia bacterium]
INGDKVQRANLDGTGVEDLGVDLLGPWGIGLDLVARTAVEGAGELPESPVLGSNYPNPFYPETVIEYSLVRPARVTVRVFDVTGSEVATLLSTQQTAGIHRVRWNGENQDGIPVSSGLYLYRLEADGFVATRSMLLVK